MLKKNKLFLKSDKKMRTYSVIMVACMPALNDTRISAAATNEPVTVAVLYDVQLSSISRMCIWLDFR